MWAASYWRASLPVAALATLALVVVPTLLMGATLPLLVGYLSRQSGNVGSSVGHLYYVNTLGAGAACLVCAVLLFPGLGMEGSVQVAVAFNAAVALGAVAAHWIAHRRHGGAMANADVHQTVDAGSASVVLRHRARDVLRQRPCIAVV